MRLLTIEEVEAVSGAHKSSFSYSYKFKSSSSSHTGTGSGGSKSKESTKIECKIKVKGHDLANLPALPFHCGCTLQLV